MAHDQQDTLDEAFDKVFAALDGVESALVHLIESTSAIREANAKVWATTDVAQQSCR